MKFAWDLVRSAKQEIWIMVSTPNAFRRQVKMGVLQLFNEVIEQNHATFRILIPPDEQITQTINEAKLVCPHVEFRVFEKKLHTRITIILIDKRECLIVESKDDTKANTYDTIGLSTYSNSKSIVLSYVSIFESLWRQTELYEQLKIHDKMQKEFINVAAHELRTPIQPIIGLSGVLHSRKEERRREEAKKGGGEEEGVEIEARSGEEEEKDEELSLLDIIIRNAKRLQRLTEDILDVSKIESQSLMLNKEKVNVNHMILNVAIDYENDIKKRNMKLEVHVPHKYDIFIEADKHKLNQVISNLLSNAVKFTKEGAISITLEKKEEDNSHDDVVIVGVKDTGNGIDPEILPRLFTKFATKSNTGTGLGLFISKSIIEAHGGRIWAENNKDSNGATFYFSIPTSK